MSSESVENSRVHRHKALKSQVAARFGLKVAGYRQNAPVQQKLLDHLLSQIMQYSAAEQQWADFGCGDGSLERKLLQQGWRGHMIGIDIASRSLHFCRKGSKPSQSWVCGDAEHPPFKGSVFHGIVAASMLQWTGHLDRTIGIIADLLNRDGFFMFSLFTDGSFLQLTETRKKLTLSPSVAYPPEATVKSLFKRSGFHFISLTPFEETVHFRSARELLRHLSAIGSTGSTNRPLSRSGLDRFCSELENTYRRTEGVPLTFKALYGTARKGG